MHPGLVFMFCSLAFSLGFCIAGLLSNRPDHLKAYGEGYEDGIHFGRAQAHKDYER